MPEKYIESDEIVSYARSRLYNIMCSLINAKDVSTYNICEKEAVKWATILAGVKNW
jgi:hypothetical protein